MVYELVKLGKARYVGDRRTKVAHDRWHVDSQGCGLGELARRGDAVGFRPDTLDGALLEGYEYCETCHDKTEPEPPEWASVSTRSAREPEREASGPENGRAGPDREPSEYQRQIAASPPKQETARVLG
jgi:hypothetical protein